MNIWIFNHYANTPRTPGGTRHFDMAQQLIRMGHNVTIFASSYNHKSGKLVHKIRTKEVYHEEIHQGVRFIWVKTNPYRKNDWRRVLNILSYTFYAHKASKRMKEEPDIVIGSLVHPLAACLGYLVARKKRCLFYFEERDLWPQTLVDLGKLSTKHPVVYLLGALELYLYKKADKIIVLFEKAPEYVKNRGIQEEKVLYLPNGINGERYRHISGALPDELQQLFTRFQEQFIAVYIGAHGIANHLDPIIDAAKLSKQRNDNIHFLFIGDGTEKKRLETRVHEEQIENVTFVPPVAKELVPSVLHQADAGLISMVDSPLYKWGFSLNKSYDYMASSLPFILLSNTERTRIEDSNGVIKVEDAAEMAEAVSMLANDRKRTKVMGKCAREYVMKHHSWEELSKQIEGAMHSDLHQNNASLKRKSRAL